MKTQGFTLIELLVVVLIIGILAAVALPQYEKAVLKARTTEPIIVLNALVNAEEIYYIANGEYTSDIGNLDITLDASLIGQGWGNATFEDKYSYVCNNSGCQAAINNTNMPTFEFTYRHNPWFPARKWCIGEKGDTGLSICKSIGSWDPQGYQGGPYYLIYN